MKLFIDSHNWWIIKQVITILVSFLLIIEAYLSFLIVNKGSSDVFKTKLENYWRMLHESSLIILPYRIIERYLNTIKLIFRKQINCSTNILIRLERNDYLITGILVIYIFFLAFFLVIQENASIHSFALLTFGKYPFLIILLLLFSPILFLDKDIAPVTVSLVAFFVLIDTIFVLPFLLSILLFVIIIIWLYTFDFEILNLDFIVKTRNIFIFLLISLILTYLSFLIGDKLNPNSYIPRTFQAISVNLVFDILTFLTTHFILTWAVFRKSTRRILSAIIADIFIASLFSVISLYLSLLNTNFEINLIQSLRVFIGLSSVSDTFSFDPLFWFMHSSLIPTLIYLILIVFSIFIKFTVITFSKILKNASLNKYPEKWLLAIFGVMIAFLILFSNISSMFYEKALEHEKQKIENNR